VIRLLPRLLARISVRLLAFNVLLVFLPASGVLVLDTYERHLLVAQERTMAQEGRLLAAALQATDNLTADAAQRILVQLGQRHQTRLRVVDRNRTLLADSARLGPRKEDDDAPRSTDADTAETKSLLYRVGALPFQILRRIESRRRDSDSLPPSTGTFGPELEAALAGDYGTATRLTPGDDSLTLYIGVPVSVGGRVTGAVLVSQSTRRILDALYAVRLDVFKVFLTSLGVAVVLSLLMAMTIARPLARLRRRSEAILDRRGRLTGSFEPSDRRDEIGDLERALAELTRRLEDHLQFTESFAADVSHEFKNPLAAIRTAAEMATDEEDASDRQRYLTMIQRDVARMERLLSGAREISRIDVEIEHEEREMIRLDGLLKMLVDSFRLRVGASGLRIVLAVARHDVIVHASPDRLTQVFENLLVNAVGFSPPGGTISIALSGDNNHALVSIADEGPGIPEEHRERIFTRFFSYRPEPSQQGDHTGLGLAIVKAIVEAYNGSITVTNREPRGAKFRVRLPTA
jgi:two-component system sensor histidine kinase ChvG